jgi:hypothetical protein
MLLFDRVDDESVCAQRTGADRSTRRAKKSLDRTMREVFVLARKTGESDHLLPETVASHQAAPNFMNSAINRGASAVRSVSTLRFQSWPIELYKPGPVLGNCITS